MSRVHAAKKEPALSPGDRVVMRDGRGARVVLTDVETVLVHAPEGDAGQRYVIVPRAGLVRG